MNKNNKILIEEFDKTYTTLTDYNIFNKIKFVKPHQIFIEGNINLEIIKQNIKILENEYDKLLLNNENKILEEKINSLETKNIQMDEEIQKLTQKINNLNKEIEDLANEYR